MLAQPNQKRGGEVSPQPSAAETRLLVAAFARIRPVALGISAGIVAGLALFVATGLLLTVAAIQADGHPVGPHLGRLGQFLPAYDVTWPGAFIGLGYGVVVGFGVGAVLGWLLNLSHTVYVRLVLRRMREGVIDGAI